MSYSTGDRYSLNDGAPINVPLNAVVLTPDIPLVDPVQRRVPAGLLAGHWMNYWLQVQVQGLAPALKIFLDWSPTGWLLQDFTVSTVPILTIIGSGMFSAAPGGVPSGAYALVRLVGDVGNGIDTQATVWLGGY